MLVVLVWVVLVRVVVSVVLVPVAILLVLVSIVVAGGVGTVGTVGTLDSVVSVPVVLERMVLLRVVFIVSVGEVRCMLWAWFRSLYLWLMLITVLDEVHWPLSTFGRYHCTSGCQC